MGERNFSISESGDTPLITKIEKYGLASFSVLLKNL